MARISLHLKHDRDSKFARLGQLAAATPTRAPTSSTTPTTETAQAQLTMPQLFFTHSCLSERDETPI